MGATNAASQQQTVGRLFSRVFGTKSGPGCPHHASHQGDAPNHNSSNSSAAKVLTFPAAYQFDGPGLATSLLSQPPNYPTAKLDLNGPHADRLDGGWGASDRPALEATRALYIWLYQHNYSVAFITGRKESGRNDTAVNLEAAGGGLGLKF